MSGGWTILIDGASRPARIMGRVDSRDQVMELGDRPLSVLADAVKMMAGNDQIGLLALVTGPGPLLTLRSAAAFVRLLAWSRDIPVVSFRSIDPLAVSLARLLRPDQRGLILEPISRRSILEVDVVAGTSEPIVQLRVVPSDELVVHAEDLVAGESSELARVHGAQVVDGITPTASELLDFATALLQRGALTQLAGLRPWYVKSSGVRRSFDVRLADGSIGKVGRDQ